LLETVYSITGRLYGLDESMPATPEMRVVIPRRLRETPSSHISAYRVVKVSQVDGTKLYLENDNWALLRFSGTEPVLRLSVEADTPQKAGELLQWLRDWCRIQKGQPQD
jgi:phosphomannomutase